MFAEPELSTRPRTFFCAELGAPSPARYRVRGLEPLLVVEPNQHLLKLVQRSRLIPTQLALDPKKTIRHALATAARQNNARAFDRLGDFFESSVRRLDL
jgi:hypothetical protein